MVYEIMQLSAESFVGVSEFTVTTHLCIRGSCTTEVSLACTGSGIYPETLLNPHCITSVRRLWGPSATGGYTVGIWCEVGVGCDDGVGCEVGVGLPEKSFRSVEDVTFVACNPTRANLQHMHYYLKTLLHLKSFGVVVFARGNKLLHSTAK